MNPDIVARSVTDDIDANTIDSLSSNYLMGTKS